jgi:acetyltransferase-like isoleucine patch superfamily enzyme
VNRDELERILKVLGNAARTPLASLPMIRAFLRGCLYIAYYRLFKRNVKIRWPFFVYGKIRFRGSNIEITGPGSVFIDRYCSVFPNIFSLLNIITLSPSAEVVIGRHCSLGGLTIRCRSRVTIGDRIMTAHALVQDCLFMHQENVRSHNPALSTMDAEPVDVGSNVWLGGQSLILSGSSIGNDSVLSWGAACYRSSVGEYCLVSGNPAQRPLSIPSVLRLTGAL